MAGSLYSAYNREVRDDQSYVVSSSHKETARTREGDHRSFGSRGIFERWWKGDDAPPGDGIRPFGWRAGPQAMASWPGRTRALL